MVEALTTEKWIRSPNTPEHAGPLRPPVVLVKWIGGRTLDEHESHDG